MKKLLLTSIIFLLTIVVFSQTNLYEHPNFDKITKDHKLIAIVPFKATVKLRPKEMKNMSVEQIQRLEVAEGENIQFAMYAWFLRRQESGKLTVKIQDPTTTNALLKQNGITYENMATYTPADYARLLGVDAVISGKFETTKPMSEGASVALALLVGFYGSTNKAVLNLFIHNGSDGELLINYNKSVSGSLGSSTEDLINTLMRKASRRISYTKND